MIEMDPKTLEWMGPECAEAARMSLAAHEEYYLDRLKVADYLDQMADIDGPLDEAQKRGLGTAGDYVRMLAQAEARSKAVSAALRICIETRMESSEANLDLVRRARAPWHGLLARLGLR